MLQYSAGIRFVYAFALALGIEIALVLGTCAYLLGYSLLGVVLLALLAACVLSLRLREIKRTPTNTTIFAAALLAVPGIILFVLALYRPACSGFMPHF